MWSVTPAFLAALPQSHRVVSTCTYTNPGGIATSIPIEGGTINLDQSANIRRKGTLALVGDSGDYAAMTVPGTIVQVKHGIRYGNTSELVPIFTGEINAAQQQFGSGAGALSVPVVDLGSWLNNCPFSVPYTPGALSRPAAVAAIVLDAMPWVTIQNSATDTGGTPTGAVWTGDRWSAINSLAADGGFQAFFDPDGAFVIRDIPTFSSAPVWKLVAMLKSAARTRPVDAQYNAVVISPAATDGSQAWATQIAQITLASHPRHPSKIGLRPLFITSSTQTTAAGAYNVALARLSLYLGTAETLDLQALSNPALEGGDCISVAVPKIRGEAGNVFTHLVDTLSLDIQTGAMQLGTISQQIPASA